MPAAKKVALALIPIIRSSPARRFRLFPDQLTRIFAILMPYQKIASRKCIITPCIIGVSQMAYLHRKDHPSSSSSSSFRGALFPESCVVSPRTKGGKWFRLIYSRVLFVWPISRAYAEAEGLRAKHRERNGQLTVAVLICGRNAPAAAASRRYFEGVMGWNSLGIRPASTDEWEEIRSISLRSVNSNFNGGG